MDSQDTDAELIAKVLLDKSQRAFAILVEKHQHRLRQYCRRLVGLDTSLADDIAQETLINAYKNLSHFKGSGQFIGWLLRIAYFQYLQYLRANKIHEPLDDTTLHTSPMVLSEPIDVERAIAQLSVNERHCITLQYSFGYTHEQIAHLVDMPLGSVKSNIKRGKIKLAKLMGQKEKEGSVTISGAA